MPGSNVRLVLGVSDSIWFGVELGSYWLAGRWVVLVFRSGFFVWSWLGGVESGLIRARRYG